MRSHFICSLVNTQVTFLIFHLSSVVCASARSAPGLLLWSFPPGSKWAFRAEMCDVPALLQASHIWRLLLGEEVLAP